ncbi:MAG: DUF1624 domain-containing protein [Proteobacteria bacterium]|nr:DUF1624 domain-containing protein [Pseudomonadota bacterium]
MADKPRARIAVVDHARGLALVAMIAYHFAFDLRMFGLTHSDFEHSPFWLAARATIVSSFLLLVGIGAVLARRDGRADAWPRYLRRTLVIAACAGLVTAMSLVMFPGSYIWFGILHAIAVMSLVAWPLANRPRLALAAGMVALVAGLTLAAPFFDRLPWSVIGFMTHKPNTEDYVPLFPWIGVMLLGIPVGHGLVRRDFEPLAALARTPRVLGFLGRHSLATYMVHQPIMVGLLYAARALGLVR